MKDFLKVWWNHSLGGIFKTALFLTYMVASTFFFRNLMYPHTGENSGQALLVGAVFAIVTTLAFVFLFMYAYSVIDKWNKYKRENR